MSYGVCEPLEFLAATGPAPRSRANPAHGGECRERQRDGDPDAYPLLDVRMARVSLGRFRASSRVQMRSVNAGFLLNLDRSMFDIEPIVQRLCNGEPNLFGIGVLFQLDVR